MEIGTAGESVRSGKEAARDMDDFEIKIGEVKQPSRLATIEVLCLTEVCQILVVSKDLDGEWGSMEVVSPRLQGTDDCEELSVVDVVIAFSWDERLREVRARVPVAIRISLEEDGARGVLGDVGGNGEGLDEVGEVEDGARQEELLQLVEGLLTIGGPIPAIVFLGEI